MRVVLSSAAVAAVLSFPAACFAAEMPFSPPPVPAEQAFVGTVPAIANLPLGTSYRDVEKAFAEAGDEFQLKRGDRELQLGNASDGSVEFSFPETLQLAGKAEGAGQFREDRTATFSSPLTGSQMIVLERDIRARSGQELSVPAFQKAIAEALGQPTGSYDESTPKWAYVWLDGRLVAAADVPQLKATVAETMGSVGVRDADLSDFERRVVSCGDLASFVSNDPLIDTANALASGNDVPEHCTALASVVFYHGSQTDLSSRIVVRIAYTGAMIQDARAVGTHMREALLSGVGRKAGVAINDF